MRRRAAALLIGSLLLAGCGGAPRGFGASGAWSRPTPATATNGVVYLELRSNTRDALIGVDVPAGIAAHAELHTSNAAGSGGHQHGAVGSDTVTMVQVTQVDIDAGTSIEFRPGGNHIMLVDLARPLVLGDTFVATLRFASGRTLDVSVTVSDNPPS
ncbi:MAG: copper chaperone PCu(A)C [Acidimicrobiales bacterium]